MDFRNKVAVVTGGTQGIGKTIANEFRKQGAIVCDIDIQMGCWFTGDLSKEKDLSEFAEKVLSEYGHIDFLVNNALPQMFHRQNFFFFNFAYQGDYGALSYQFDNRITVHEGECYIDQPYAGYAPNGQSEEEIIIFFVNYIGN